MPGKNHLTTVIASIAIADVEKNLACIHSENFNDNEVEELSKRHVRSTAGWLVLKQALCKLLKQLQIAQVTEKDFCLKRTQAGRPYIDDINITHTEGLELLEKLFVSISHTKTTAYGMAVFESYKNET